MEVRRPGGQPLWVLVDRLAAVQEAVAAAGPPGSPGGRRGRARLRDRALAVDPDHARRVKAGGGLVRPTVVADGRVVGTWRYLRGRRGEDPDTVEVTPFGAAPPAGLGAEVADVGRFLGTAPALAVRAGAGSPPRRR